MKEKKRKCVVQKEPSEVLLEKILWRRRFSLNFAKFLRPVFLQNNSGRLLLYDVCFWQFFENKKSENSRIFILTYVVFYSIILLQGAAVTNTTLIFANKENINRDKKSLNPKASICS